MQEGIPRSLVKPLMLRKGNTMGNVGKMLRCQPRNAVFTKEGKEGVLGTKFTRI